MPNGPVFVDETSGAPRRIEGVSMSTTAFVGPTLMGPTRLTGLTGPTQPNGPAAGVPALLTHFGDFERLYGGLEDLPASDAATPAQRRNYVAHAVHAFFANGGRRLVVLRVNGRGKRLPTVAGYRRALQQLRKLPEVALVAAPGSSARDPADATAIAKALIAHAAEARLYRIAIVDPPPALEPAAVMIWRQALGDEAERAALYYPWLTVPYVVSKPPAAGPNPAEIDLPPSGFLCGIVVRVETERGLARPPTDEVIVGALRAQRAVNAAEQDVLNPAGVNCIRSFAARGLRVWGGRTLSSAPEGKYFNVRRTLDYLQASIERGLQWVVFEPNGERLWAKVRASVENFLLTQWRNQSLPGRKPEEAFFVRCDRSTMTQNDIDSGRLICLIGLAVLKPAEFVIVRIGLKTAAASD